MLNADADAEIRAWRPEARMSIKATAVVVPTSC
jgi:hypothetical protein